MGMHRAPSLPKPWSVLIPLCGCMLLACCASRTLAAQATGPAVSTAWKAGHFVVDTAGLVGRSDIVLSAPNRLPSEAIPLGNGRLGVAVWAADGFTAQLNRGDTLPHRDSPGQLIIPGLAALTAAQDFTGRLDLFNGSLLQQGGGLTLRAYVQISTDTLVIDVTGADPPNQTDRHPATVGAPYAAGNGERQNRTTGASLDGSVRPRGRGRALRRTRRSHGYRSRRIRCGERYSLSHSDVPPGCQRSLPGGGSLSTLQRSATPVGRRPARTR